MKKKKIVCLTISLIIVAIIVIVIIAVGFQGGLPQDEVKQQFPATLNVELADAAGFSNPQIQNAPYFYYDTKITEEKKFFQPPVYQGCDDGCVMFYEDATTTRASSDIARQRIEDKLFQRASTFITGFTEKVDELNYVSGGEVVTEYDEGVAYTDDYTYSLRSEIYDRHTRVDAWNDPYNTHNEYGLVPDVNVTINNTQYAQTLFVEYEWWVWSEGSGGGWRAFFTTIYASFIANYDQDVIITIISHGADPDDATQNMENAYDTDVYTAINTTGYYNGAPVHSKGKYDTFSGTRLSNSNDDPTKLAGVGGGNLANWFTRDTEHTQKEDGDPGTYGYFIAYSHTGRYTAQNAYGHGYRGGFSAK